MTQRPRRSAYSLLESTGPRHGLSNSRRAFYRLYIYSYEIALHLQLPLPNIVNITSITDIDHTSKNPTKKLAISLQWYLLVTEELSDSIFEVELRTSPKVSRTRQVNARVYPRDHFDHLTVRETLFEARRIIQTVLKNNISAKSYILDDFEDFFVKLSECNQCPCQFNLDTSNSEIRKWVIEYKETQNKQVNTLNPRNYSQRLRNFDDSLSYFLDTSCQKFQDWPSKDINFLVSVLLFLIIPAGEYLSYADYINSLNSKNQKVPPQVVNSILTYYVVLNPAYLKKIKGQPQYKDIKQFSDKIAKLFGSYQIKHLFPKSSLIYDVFFDRLTVEQWLLCPIPSEDDLKSMHGKLQSERNKIIFHEFIQNKPPQNLEHNLHRNILLRSLQSILQQGVGVLKLHSLSSEIQHFITAVLKNLWFTEWVDIQERPEIQSLATKINETIHEVEFYHIIWKKLIHPKGLLQQTSDAWHQRHELSSGYCVLDMNDGFSEKCQQFINDWQHIIKEILIDSEVLLLLIEYFERTTAERHRPNDLQLHGMIASQYSPSEPATFATVPSMSTNYITDVWKAVVHSIKQAEQKDLYHEFTLVLSALEETNLDDLLP